MENMSFCQQYATSAYLPFFCSPYLPFLAFCNPLESCQSVIPSNLSFASHSFYTQQDIDCREHPAPFQLPTESQTNPLPLPQEQKVRRVRGRRCSAEQKENRNVYSNILRNFFRKVKDPARIERTVQQIILRNRLAITPADFHEHVRHLKVNHGKYLRFKKLRPLFVDPHQPQHALIFRSLFEHMATGELLTQTLTSRKIGRWSVLLHLRGTRELKERLYH